jgi:peptide methionine sulfoxide reductase msrA/msrB
MLSNKEGEMKNKNLFILILITLFNLKVSGQEAMKFNLLTPEEERVIVKKGTEMPFTGKYWNSHETGVYVCKRCNTPLYKSSDKFDSDCGWPSFDAEIPGAVKRVPDADGNRTEILCAKCGAHLGHVFLGEHLTAKNTRYCVNSISMNFTPANQETKTETAIFAGGCFWGVDYYMSKIPGVISSTAGYIGGTKENPTYEDVCSHTTGYAEAVEILFDPDKASFEQLARMFFEIHDPTQLNHQGPDYGDQYRSEIFYASEQQKAIAEKLINVLKEKGFKVVTKITPATKFWKAEDYHQDYYDHKGGTPYCHAFVKRF